MTASQQTLFTVGHLLDMSNTAPTKNEKTEKISEKTDGNKTHLAANIDILTKLSINPVRETFADVSNMSNMSNIAPSNTDNPANTQPVWIGWHAHNSPNVEPASRGRITFPTWLAYCQHCELKKPFTDDAERDVWVATHRRNHPDHRTMKGAGT